MALAVDKEALLKKYERNNAAAPGPRKGAGGPGGGPRGRGALASGKPKNMRQTIGRLLAYTKGDRHKFIIVAICLLGNSISMLAGSYVLRPVLNSLVDTETTVAQKGASLVLGLAVMATIYLLGVICNYGQMRLMLGISQNALQKLRDDLFNKMQKLPVRFFDTNSNGELMSRFTNDVDTIGELFNTTLVQLISGIISIIGTFCLMLYTNVALTILTIISIPVIARTGLWIASKSRTHYKAQQAALGAVNGYIEETVTGQKVVKVFNHESTAQAEFQILSDNLQKRQMKAQFIGGIMGPVMGNLGQLSYAITATVGAVLCVTSGFDIGGLTIFVNYSRQFSRPINELSMQMNVIFSALAGAERVFDILDQEPEKEDAPDAVDMTDMRGYVKLTDVTFGYTPEKTILKNVSCYAKPGQKIAFVGSTGAGKTTITNLINRFYDIEEGVITIDGVDVKNIKRDTLRKNIAMVLQDTHLFTGTVMENIRYGRPDATDEEVIGAAKLASAHSFIMRLSDGYNTMLEGDGANLSQGQRQLLNIARAAVSKAPILILDEATSSVDTRTERHIEHGMDRLMKDRTTFVIAHRLSTVRNSHAIMVLEQGEIIERGTHDELLAMGGRYYNLYTGKAELA
ncbi:MAG: ABC transporter ATP-binding protein [Lachnospiraceae bacterium]|nr:ABC transporter ATP-binding protein [Lachnospiraceae bacterium]